jgi:protein O-GlcNAc transferase
MDVDRFAAALPELFDDLPRSEHPRGRRFDDVIEAIPNLAEENVLALLNLAASLLGPGESYVEVGTYYGASLIGAMRDNQGDFVAIDRFSFGAMEVAGRRLPAASREGLEANLRRFGADCSVAGQSPPARRTGEGCSVAGPSPPTRRTGRRATILEGDAFELLEGGALGDRRVGVYYYDGPHDYESQVRGLRAVEPWLAGEALLVVDDHDWEEVARATRDYLAEQPRTRTLFEIGGRSKGQPQWWAGVAVLGWKP